VTFSTPTGDFTHYANHTSRSELLNANGLRIGLGLTFFHNNTARLAGFGDRRIRVATGA
jgi:hypothetical protein